MHESQPPFAERGVALWDGPSAAEVSLGPIVLGCSGRHAAAALGHPLGWRESPYPQGDGWACDWRVDAAGMTPLSVGIGGLTIAAATIPTYTPA